MSSRGPCRWNRYLGLPAHLLDRGAGAFAPHGWATAGAAACSGYGASGDGAASLGRCAQEGAGFASSND